MKPKPPTPATNPVLYILMRNDMDSLNPGKMVAQGAHAANQFTAFMDRQFDQSTDSTCAMYHEWLEQGKDFGTTICLGVDGATLSGVVQFLRRAGFPAEVTHDPSYPLSDGRTLHLLPLDTCGFAFGDKDALRPILSQFGLLP